MIGTIARPIDPDKGCRLQDLLDLNSGLFFDENVFRAACQDLGQGSEAESWSRDVSIYDTAEKFILGVPEEMREQFLVLYIYHFSRHLVV